VYAYSQTKIRRCVVEIRRPPDLRAGQPLGWAKGAAVIGAKGFVFLSGVTGRDPKTGKPVEGVKAQTKVIFESIKRKLEELGTSLENICHIRMDWTGESAGAWEALQEFWKENCPRFAEDNPDRDPPAMTGLQVTALALPEMFIEVTVIAAIP